MEMVFTSYMVAYPTNVETDRALKVQNLSFTESGKRLTFTRLLAPWQLVFISKLLWITNPGNILTTNGSYCAFKRWTTPRNPLYL